MKKKLTVFTILITFIFSSFSFSYADPADKFDAVWAIDIVEELDEMYDIDLSDLDPYNVRMIYASIKAMYNKEPELTEYGLQHLKEVSWMPSEIPGRYAQTYRTGGIIELSHGYYDDECKIIKGRYFSSTLSGYHPVGTNYNAVFMHEFGHVIDGAFMVEHKYDGYAIELVVKQAYEESGTDHSFYGWQTSISTYAGMNSVETFAEAWCDYIQNGENCEQASLEVVNALKDAYEEYEDYEFDEPEPESVNWYDNVYACAE